MKSCESVVKVTNREHISYKDTYQVAVKIREYVKNGWIYTKNKSWYIFDDFTGIYNVTDCILGVVCDVVDKMKEECQRHVLPKGECCEEWTIWKSITYRKDLIRELRPQCLVNVEFDTNPYLLGFPGGVYDLQTGVFRKGLREEYVSMKCGVEYDSTYDTSQSISFLREIFTDPEEYEYALNRLCLALDGSGGNKVLTFNYGPTASNGKSFLMETMYRALGDYADHFPNYLLTTKQSDTLGKVGKDILSLHKKRFVYCGDPEVNKKINTKLIKCVTQYNHQIKNMVPPTFSIFVCCNGLPKLDSCSVDAKNTIRVIPYRTRFIKTPKRVGDKVLRFYSEDQKRSLAKGIIKLLIDRFVGLKQSNFTFTEPKQVVDLRNTLYK